MTIVSTKTGSATKGELGSASPAMRTNRRMEPDVTGFYEATTGSVQYVVADPLTRRCAVIDPVLEFDPRSGSTRTTSADRLLRHIASNGLTLEWILDTHPHADHLSAAGYLKDMTGAATGLGERVTEVQKLWKEVYDWANKVPTDGSQWDHLFANGERFTVGEMEAWYCCPLAIPSARSPMSSGTRPLFTIHFLCPIREQREPIFREATLGSSGAAFSGFCGCRARLAFSPGMTIVRAVGRLVGRALSLSRRRKTYI
jgi:Metallo-beta-lactamase superfamily